MKGAGKGSHLVKNVSPDDATQLAELTKMLVQRPSSDLNDLERLETDFVEYLDWCAERGYTFTLTGAYAYMGVSKQTISDWRLGIARANDPRYKDFVERLDRAIGTSLEWLAFHGKIEKELYMFCKKVWFKEVEEQHVLASKTQLLGQTQNVFNIGVSEKEKLQLLKALPIYDTIEGVAVETQ